MNFKAILSIWITMLAFGLTGCGKPAAPPVMTVSGTVDGQVLRDHLDRPILVAVIGGGKLDLIQTDPANAIIAYVPIDKNDLSFHIDLSDKGLQPGATVYVAAFVDINASGSVPYPDPGDFIGIYVKAQSLSAEVTLQYGDTGGIHIDVDREIFDFEASVSGTILGNDTGQLTLIAYAGEFTSSDFTSLDASAVIGYQQLTKSAGPMTYTLPILPYGYDVPIEKVLLVTWLDVNSDGILNAGDKIGYFSGDTLVPAPVTLTANENTGLDVAFFMDIDYPPVGGAPDDGTTPISLEGSITLADAVKGSDAPVYVVVMDGSADIGFDDLVQSVIYFQKLPAGQSTFTVDLSKTGLKPGDAVIIIGLLDVDFVAGFPNPTPGDWIGLQTMPGSLSTAHVLTAGVNNGIALAIDREVYDFTADIHGTVQGGGSGDVYIVPYAGEINSSNFADIAMQDVIGFATYADTNLPVDYDLSILPFGKNVPIQNVFLMAILDRDRNGRVDPGDGYGFHLDPSTYLPALLTIQDETSIAADIQINASLPIPSGSSIILEGDVAFSPADTRDDKPVFLMAASGTDLEALFNDPLSAIAYFEKLPSDATHFSLDLSSTALTPDDEIMLLALWDRDYTAGFPNPTAGDKIAVFQNKTQMRQSLRLADWPADPAAAGWEFLINRIIYDHSASVSFQLETDGVISLTPGDPIIFIAVQSDGVEAQWSLTPPDVNFVVTDTDYVVGLQTTTINAQNQYSLAVLSAIYEDITVQETPFALNSVYIFAVLDANDNGRPDSGEYAGFYWFSFFGLYVPDTVNLQDGVNALDHTIYFSEENQY